MFKFRSMILHDDKKVIQAVEGGEITRVGEFLRKTSLDEIPQLFNILLGDMSLIGMHNLMLLNIMSSTQKLLSDMMRDIKCCQEF